MFVEEICLSAVDADVDQPSDDQEVIATLDQVSWFRRCRSEFTLLNNQRLSVGIHDFMQDARTYTVDISILDPHPKRSLKICWSAFLVFSVLCGATLTLVLTDILLNATALTAILGVCAGLSLVLVVYRSHDRLVFYSQYGRAPLIVLFNRSPYQNALDSFAGTLIKHIKSAKTRHPDINETLIAELKSHRHLMEEGGISRKSYDLIKQRILSQHIY